MGRDGMARSVSRQLHRPARRRARAGAKPECAGEAEEGTRMPIEGLEERSAWTWMAGGPFGSWLWARSAESPNGGLLPEMPQENMSPTSRNVKQIQASDASWPPGWCFLSFRAIRYQIPGRGFLRPPSRARSAGLWGEHSGATLQPGRPVPPRCDPHQISFETSPRTFNSMMMFSSGESAGGNDRWAIPLGMTKSSPERRVMFPSSVSQWMDPL